MSRRAPAAASSTASGSPSRRRQIAATVGAVASSRSNVAPAAAVRSRNSCAAGEARTLFSGRPSSARERRERDLVLGADAEGGPAGDQHHQVRAVATKVGHRRRRVEQVLEVVQDDQQPPTGQDRHQPGHECRPTRSRGRPGQRRPAAARVPARAAWPDRRTRRRRTRACPRRSTSSATRVLPTPPGPVRVTSGGPRGQQHRTVSTSWSRPRGAGSRSVPARAGARPGRDLGRARSRRPAGGHRSDQAARSCSSSSSASARDRTVCG